MYLSALALLWPALKEYKKLAILVICYTLAMIGLDVAFNYWRKYFYNSLQAYDAHQVFLYLGVFAILVTVYVLVAGFSNYFQRFLEFGVREHLFIRFSKTWKQANVKNPEQRLSEDGILFARLSLTLLQSLMIAIIKLPVYMYILYSVASWYVAAILLVYAMFGTVLSKVVSKKLVDLEYQQQGREADFRKKITYATDNNSIFPTMDEIKLNWVELARQNKLLQFFQSGFSQIGCILPYVMLIPLYLTKKILLGGLLQVAGAANEVLDSLSVLVNSRQILVELTMCTRRLKEMDVDK